MNDIIFFDLDGTLTPHRQEMDPRIADSLLEILRSANVGIITGSPIEYVRDQTRALFNSSNSSLVENIMIFPCNGTQEYSWDNHEQNFIKVRSTDMREYLGEVTFQQIMWYIINSQSNEISSRPDMLEKGFPLTGHFISYRQSMINWAPAGRNMTLEDREKFVKLDQEYNFRDRILQHSVLPSLLKRNDLVIVKGGQTSFDIYPKGWDKTYVLDLITKFDRIWFLGDSCQEGGNDYTFYKDPRVYKAFEVLSPDDCIDKVKNLILPEVIS